MLTYLVLYPRQIQHSSFFGFFKSPTEQAWNSKQKDVPLSGGEKGPVVS